MRIDVSQAVTALVEAELTAEKWEKGRYVPSGIVVTISHELGSGGHRIARDLGEQLGVPYYDREILDAMVQAAPQDKALLERLDRQASTRREEVMRQIIEGKSAVDEYRRLLVNVVLGIARNSGVIVGRHAHWVLAGHKVFRVRVVASPQTCAERLAEREGISIEEALEHVRQDRADHASLVRQLTQQDIDEPHCFDLTLNTDHIPPGLGADIIRDSMERSGFAAPRRRSDRPVDSRRGTFVV